MSAANITWSLGGEAELVLVDGLRITLRSTRLFPPGAPASGTLHAGVPFPFTLKVADARREGERFVVRGRLVGAPVELVAAFARAVQPGSGP